MDKLCLVLISSIVYPVGLISLFLFGFDESTTAFVLLALDVLILVAGIGVLAPLKLKWKRQHQKAATDELASSHPSDADFETHVHAAFKAFDLEGRDFLGRKEVRLLLTKLRPKMTGGRSATEEAPLPPHQLKRELFVAVSSRRVSAVAESSPP